MNVTTNNAPGLFGYAMILAIFLSVAVPALI